MGKTIRAACRMTLWSTERRGWSASRKARVVQVACFCQPRNERFLQLNFGLFCLKHRMATLPTLNAEVEYCTQGQVLFKSWTSAVPQSKADASSSGYDGVKTACKTLQMKD